MNAWMTIVPQIGQFVKVLRGKDAGQLCCYHRQLSMNDSS